MIGHFLTAQLLEWHVITHLGANSQTFSGERERADQQLAVPVVAVGQLPAADLVLAVQLHLPLPHHRPVVLARLHQVGRNIRGLMMP